MDYKAATTKAYDRYADAYAKKFAEHFFLVVRDEADAFLKVVPGKTILDIGAGAGDHARYFAAHGYRVQCGDLSEAMVARCREKGLAADIMDLEQLTLPANAYDGIWMYCSLLHVPRIKAPDVIETVAAALRSGGILGLAVKEGEGEGLEKDKYAGAQRWFTYFSDDEIRAYTDPHFELLHKSSTNVVNKYTFLNYLFRKR